MNADINIIPRDWEEDSAIIKVIGVGGGGCNAVNYMYKQNIQGCSFIVCNTDAQALASSEVPVKIQMGQNGLGAGTDPTAGRNAARKARTRLPGRCWTAAPRCSSSRPVWAAVQVPALPRSLPRWPRTAAFSRWPL